MVDNEVKSSRVNKNDEIQFNAIAIESVSKEWAEERDITWETVITTNSVEVDLINSLDLQQGLVIKAEEGGWKELIENKKSNIKTTKGGKSKIEDNDRAG